MIRFLSLVAVIALMGSVLAADKANTKGPYKITGVDVQARTITVAVAKDKEETYEVSKKAKITVKGAKDKKLEDVSLNLVARLTLDKDKKAVEIVADRAKKK
jgi:hypothetical protein